MACCISVRALSEAVCCCAGVQVQPNGKQLQIIGDYFRNAEIKLIVEKIFKLDQIRRATSPS